MSLKRQLREVKRPTAIFKTTSGKKKMNEIWGHDYQRENTSKEVFHFLKN